MKRGIVGRLAYLFALSVGVFTDSIALVLAVGVLMLVEAIETKR